MKPALILMIVIREVPMARKRRPSRWVHWDDPKKKPCRDGLTKVAPRSAHRVEHTEWAKALAERHGLERALQIVRPLAVDFHIGFKKQSSPNESKEFYRSAFNYLRNVFKSRTAQAGATQGVSNVSAG